MRERRRLRGQSHRCPAVAQQRVVGVHENLKEGFRLGELIVEPYRGRITDRDESRHLSPKAAEVLLCLAARPNEIVSRSELLEAAWGHAAASQEALSHAISALRTALDDHRQHPRYIQTVPRRGYRLLVEPAAVGEVAGCEQPLTGKPDFITELKRRGVIETGLAYLVLGWLLIQVADVTFDQLLLPRWLGTFVTILVIAGFPIALLLAWFIDIVEGRAVLDRGRARKANRSVVSRTYTSILGALVLASVGVYSFDYFFGLPSVADASAFAASDDIAVATPIEPNSIAILPFLNIDGSEETRIFAEGLAEDLINRLAKVPALRVSARSDSFSMSPNAGSEEVRKRLRVSYYLEGSVRVLNERLRVVIQLIDSSNGFQLLSRSFDRDRREFFAIQDEIASRAVANLRVALPRETQIVPASLTENDNIDAYVLYRRGVEALHRPVTSESIREALGWFDEALNEDPEYAAAHAGKCTTYVAGFDVVVDDPKVIDLARESCAAALSRNPNLDIVHVALGRLHEQTGQYAEAEAAYQRALAIDGHNVEALIGLAAYYHRMERPGLAEEKYREAIGLQPGNWRTYNDLGTFLYSLGRYLEAAENFRKVISLDPGNRQGYANLGAALMLSGDFAGAAPAFARSIEIEPQRDAYSNLGVLYYYLGQLDESIAAHEKAAELAPNDHLTWSNLGDALSASGDMDRARAAFRRASEMAESRLAVNATDPDTMAELAWIRAMLGEMEQAQDLVARAERIKAGDPYIHFISGLISAQAGDIAAAYENLESAIDMGFPPQMVSAEPHLSQLRGEPRFVALTASEATRRDAVR